MFLPSLFPQCYKVVPCVPVLSGVENTLSMSEISRRDWNHFICYLINLNFPSIILHVLYSLNVY